MEMSFLDFQRCSLDESMDVVWGHPGWVPFCQFASFFPHHFGIFVVQSVSSKLDICWTQSRFKVLLVLQVLWTYGLLKDNFFENEMCFVSMRSLFFLHNLNFFPCPKNLNFKKVFNKTWFTAAGIAFVLWLCRHGKGAAFGNLQWRFQDEGKLRHVKLNLFYI